MRCLKTGKIQHRNMAAANKHAAVYLMTTGWLAIAYKCPWCGYFHVTRKKQVDTRKK